jgi:hypothetical protein
VPQRNDEKTAQENVSVYLKHHSDDHQEVNHYFIIHARLNKKVYHHSDRRALPF